MIALLISFATSFFPVLTMYWRTPAGRKQKENQTRRRDKRSSEEGGAGEEEGSKHEESGPDGNGHDSPDAADAEKYDVVLDHLLDAKKLNATSQKEYVALPLSCCLAHHSLHSHTLPRASFVFMFDTYLVVYLLTLFVRVAFIFRVEPPRNPNSLYIKYIPVKGSKEELQVFLEQVEGEPCSRANPCFRGQSDSLTSGMLAPPLCKGS